MQVKIIHSDARFLQYYSIARVSKTGILNFCKIAAQPHWELYKTRAET